MSVHHIGGREDVYVIVTERTSKGQAPWRSKSVGLHAPNVEASAEWSMLGRGHGWGIQFGRNGSDSDAGLDVYAGRIGSLWMRIRHPHLKFLRVTKEQDDKGWYEARHTSLHIHPYGGCWVRWQFDAKDSEPRDAPWWREWKLTQYNCNPLGRQVCETTVDAEGTCVIPMPEGPYGATWKREVRVWRRSLPLGRLRDWIYGPVTRTSVDIRVAGGIPCEGKGENSWDCGMDGIFGTGGKTLEEGIGNYVQAVLRERTKNGGPHNLTQPMTVREASV